VAADRRRVREEAKLERIRDQYELRVAAINTDAGRRGMLNSTVVLDQLDRARDARDAAEDAVHGEIAFIESRKALDMERVSLQHDARVSALAKRLMVESSRQALAAAREKAVQKRHNLRDFMSMQQMRLTIPVNVAQIVLQEIYDEYVAWLVRQSPARAFALVDYDPLFYWNLGMAHWLRLFDEFWRRTVQVV